MSSKGSQIVEETSEGRMINVFDHQAGETSGGGDKMVNDFQSFVIDIPEKDPKPVPPPAPSEFKSSEVPMSSKGMLVTEGGNAQTVRNCNKLKNKDHVEEVNNSGMSSIIEEKFKSLDDALVVEDCLPKIQRVPSIMKRNGKNNKYYRPKMISIGPYYYKSSRKLELTEKFKLKLAALFIKENKLHKDVPYSKIKREIKDLRKYYVDRYIKRFNDDDLVWMFFVDGCAILHHIRCVVDRKTKRLEELKKLKVKVECFIIMGQDLFLLENQLPYRVLELLMSCLENGNDMRKSIEEFIFRIIKAPGEKQVKREYQQCQNESPVHLLHLLRERLLQSVEEDQTQCSIFEQLKDNAVEFIREPFEIFQNLIEYIGKTLESSSNQQSSSYQQKHYFRSVEELQAAGIRFRPSNTGRLTDISYKLGTLKLPSIIVDNFTASKFLNLIAYEMCPDFVNDFGVSSYIAFLDALIDRAHDVKELRDKQILLNALCSDEEVASLFNVIGTDLVSNANKYLNVKSDIQNRYDNKWMTWIAQFIHRHFQSPWSVLTFIAAIIVLASSVVQTVYTVLGYYK